MAEMTDELLERIAERASDPKRRYMTAADDEAAVVLPVEEIERRKDAWRERGLIRGAALEGKQLSKAEIESALAEGRAADQELRRLMDIQMRAFGHTDPRPTVMTLHETEHSIGVSSRPPGATPLQPPPSEADWRNLEQIAGAPVPDDLKRLYSISNGGFGPGFTGLNSAEEIGTHCENFRRSGPDYSTSVNYPNSFIPIAMEALTYHYDRGTGRIISSDGHYRDHELDDPYAIAFQSLADMMEDWLRRS